LYHQSADGELMYLACETKVGYILDGVDWFMIIFQMNVAIFEYITFPDTPKSDQVGYISHYIPSVC